MSDDTVSDLSAQAAVESQGTAITTRGGMVVRDHDGPEMSMTELAGWFNANGGMGWQAAIKEAAFMLCCDVIAQDVAKATLQLREMLDNGTSRVVRPNQHPIAELLALEPNPSHTWYEFVEMQVYWSCFTRNSYAGVIRNNVNDVLELIPFQSTRIYEKVNGRELFYDVFAGTQNEQRLLGASQRTFAERDMIHVRRRMIDGMDGYSTLEAGSRTLQIAKAIADFRSTLFSEEGQIRGVFTRTDATAALPEEIFQRVKAQFKYLMNRFRQQNEPIVLEGGLDFKPISSKPQEIELSKQFEQQITETCRMLRVPPHKVFQMEGIKYENLETSEKMYVGDTLVPVCEPFEQRMAKTLLSRKDRSRFFFQHNRDEMTLRDTKAETERAFRSLTSGAIDWDEYRAVIGLNPLPNGQGKHRIVPANMNVVDEHGNVVIGADPNAPAPKDEDTSPTPEPKKSLPAPRLVAVNER